VLGAALILHALAHAAALTNAWIQIGASHGSATAERAHLNLWWASLLGAFTIAALIAGGLGSWHVRVFAARWRAVAMTGLCASLAFLLSFEPPAMTVGVIIDWSLLFLLYMGMRQHVLETQPSPAQRTTRARRVIRYLWLTAIAGLALSVAMRPVFLRWGTRPREAYFQLPGDRVKPGTGFQILHAINIKATPEQVWPWLAQIGHDRGGFYSYSWLENLFGLHVVNAERIVSDWQTRRVGEVVPATPPNWLGLVEQPLGWRVTRFEPGRVLFLENWGAFALVRIDPATTRLYIRTHGEAGRLASFWSAPLDVFVFVPAHFIMQRKMLLGIKERAERAAREQRSAFVPGPAGPGK
jgi:hypothetical protein